MKPRWIVTAVAAAALIGAGCSQMHKGKEKEGDEVKMSINDIPAAARESLMKEAPGATITTVDKETKDGKTVYEADAMMGGKNWEIIVDDNGKVISKKLDEESGEKKEDEEKEKK
jgi:uncharacterized membrane protein YkoI